MATYAYPLTAGFGAGYTGLAASLRYAVADSAGTIRIAATATGIAETVAGSGSYEVTATLDTAWPLPLKVTWTYTGDATFCVKETILGDTAASQALGYGTTVTGVASLLATTARFAALPTAGTVADLTPTTTAFTGDASLSSEDDTYNLRTLQFTSGDLTGCVRSIADYTGATREFSFSLPFPGTPADGDTFEVV